MSAAVLSNTFHELEQKIRNELVRGLKLQLVSTEEVLAILTIFAEATNHNELKLFCEIFAKDFPILGHIVEEKAHQDQENIQFKIKEAVSKLIHTNPLLATKIAKAGLTPNITWDELVIEFPELEQQ